MYTACYLHQFQKSLSLLLALSLYVIIACIIACYLHKVQFQKSVIIGDIYFSIFKTVSLRSFYIKCPLPKNQYFL